VDINRNNKSDVKELKNRVFEIIQIGQGEDVISVAFDIFISAVIIISIAVTFLHTFDSLSSYRPLFHVIEYVTTIIFIIEYAARIWTSNLLYPTKKFPWNVIRYIFSFYGLVDLLTIISYFSIIHSNGFIALKIIRVARIFRLFRVNRQKDAFNVVAEVINEKKTQILSSLFMVLMLLLAASLAMYGIEHDAQPEVFNNAFAGIWWAMSTVLTVGYGDIYPITTGGQAAAIIIAVLGVGAVAIPTGIISAGFVEYYTKYNNINSNIAIKNDIRDMLENQAKDNNLSVDDYLERIILEKDFERKNKTR